MESLERVEAAGRPGSPEVEVGLDDLYRSVILEHYRQPRNHGRLAQATLTAEGKNPLCGDEVRFQILLRRGVIEEIAFTGHGCAISVASASMLTELLRGKALPEARRLIALTADFLKGQRQGMEEEELGDVAALEGVAKFPVRIKCALLPFVAVRSVLPENSDVGCGEAAADDRPPQEHEPQAAHRPGVSGGMDPACSGS